MVWLPFGKSQNNNSTATLPVPQSPQVEQRSHNSVGLLPNQSDIETTLNQIADQRPEIQALQKQSNEENNKAVINFVEQHPGNLFIIDGEKYAKESIICTNNGRGEKTCLKLMYNLIQLFKQMQKLEYFCSLPNDIDATYFECRKIT